MTKRKRVSRFVYTGLGFPIELRNVDLVQFRGVWAPDVRLNELTAAAFVALATKPAGLTGNEVRFVRQHLRLTLQALAGNLRVTHQAVLKWERAGDAVTAMTWGTEVALRLAILAWAGVSPRAFLEAYRTISAPRLEPVESVVLAHDPDDPSLAAVGWVAPSPRSPRASRTRARRTG